MRNPGSHRRRNLLALWPLLAFFAMPAAGSIAHLEFLGEARIPGGLLVEGSPVGGLSGITYDSRQDVYLTVADDPSARAPARFYTLRIDLGQGRLESDGVQVEAMTVILSPTGEIMERLSIDPEGIALHPEGDLFISSEGQVRRQVAPFVRRFTRAGAFLQELPLPDRYLPVLEETGGPRHNLVFESLTLTPDGTLLFTAMENALVEDGPAAALGIASPSRLLRYELEGGTLAAEYLYLAEPVVAAASVPDGLEVSGLVDLLALDGETLLAMERSFSMGVGNSIRLFLARLSGATDISGIPELAAVDLGSLVPVEKELLLDLGDLGIYLDNLEGMTLGPPLEDGRQTLLLVSDDNFNPLVQTTQILAFALGSGPVDIEAIQGAGHRSPFEGRWVRGVVGLVTGDYPEKQAGFWMEAESEDGFAASSRGILVLQPEPATPIVPGHRVRVDGRVLEAARPGDLGTTSLHASAVEILAPDQPLPPPVDIGRGGRRPPTEVVDNDGLRVFEPEFDGLDFWESLEGMRVVLTDPPVVEPTNRYGDLTIDASSSPLATATTPAGGLLLRPGDLNPERLSVDFAALGESPAAAVGSVFQGRLQGIVGYRHSTYRLYVQEPLPSLQAAAPPRESTELTAGQGRLTIATFNVLNLSAAGPESRFRALAEALTVSLGGPDIVALQEVQDDTGSVDDGVVTAEATLQRLVEAVADAGGPTYMAYEIDPQDNRDGGQPGSNIRPAFLIASERVTLVDRGGAAGSLEGAAWQRYVGGVGLRANPARLAPSSPAFAGDESRGFSASRKPLVIEVEFAGRRLMVVNNHWSSKGGDDSTFGDRQPPIRHSEDQRSQQARLVADFVEELLELDPTAGIVVLGDLNEHEFRSPLRILTASGLQNLLWDLPSGDRYTFNFRGNSQVLDHILVNDSLLERARARLDIVHINSNWEPAGSSSDHDPLVVELDFDVD